MLRILSGQWSSSPAVRGHFSGIGACSPATFNFVVVVVVREFLIKTSIPVGKGLFSPGLSLEMHSPEGQPGVAGHTSCLEG